MTPKHVDAAVENANHIAKGPWPPVWRFPPPSQVDAVWDALGPARDHIEAKTREPMERNAQDSPDVLVAIARTRVLDIEMHVNAPNPANRPFNP